MTDTQLLPRVRFWQRITPVLDQEIPIDAQWGLPHWAIDCTSDWNENAFAHKRFTADDLKVQWRVPVTVVPISVAVALVEELFHRGFRDMFGDCSDTTATLSPAVAKLLYHRGEEFVEAVRKSQV